MRDWSPAAAFMSLAKPHAGTAHAKASATKTRRTLRKPQNVDARTLFVISPSSVRIVRSVAPSVIPSFWRRGRDHVHGRRFVVDSLGLTRERRKQRVDDAERDEHENAR